MQAKHVVVSLLLLLQRGSIEGVFFCCVCAQIRVSSETSDALRYPKPTAMQAKQVVVSLLRGCRRKRGPGRPSRVQHFRRNVEGDKPYLVAAGRDELPHSRLVGSRGRVSSCSSNPSYSSASTWALSVRVIEGTSGVCGGSAVRRVGRRCILASLLRVNMGQFCSTKCLRRSCSAPTLTLTLTLALTRTLTRTQMRCVVWAPKTSLVVSSSKRP